MAIAAFTLRGLAARITLAVLLLFSQQLAIQHDLQHGLDAVAGKSQPSSALHNTCLQCIAFAGIGGSPIADTPAVAAPELGHVLIEALACALVDAAAFRAYNSRAPPLNA